MCSQLRRCAIEAEPEDRLQYISSMFPMTMCYLVRPPIMSWSMDPFVAGRDKTTMNPQHTCARNRKCQSCTFLPLG